MLINSLEFVLFTAVFFAALPLLRQRDGRRRLYLTAASFFFYGWWDARFLLLISAGGFIDSFFSTFPSMSDTSEAHLGDASPTRNAFHLIDWPSILLQLVEAPSTAEEQRWEGTRLIPRGFFRKSVMADSPAPVVPRGFGSGTGFTKSRLLEG